MVKTFTEYTNQIQDIQKKDEGGFYCLLKQCKSHLNILAATEAPNALCDIAPPEHRAALLLLVEERVQNNEMSGTASLQLKKCITAIKRCSLIDDISRDIMLRVDRDLDKAKQRGIKDYKLSFNEDEQQILRSVLTGENEKNMAQESLSLITGAGADLVTHWLSDEIDKREAMLKHQCRLPDKDQWHQYVIPYTTTNDDSTENASELFGTLFIEA